MVRHDLGVSNAHVLAHRLEPRPHKLTAPIAADDSRDIKYRQPMPDHDPSHTPKPSTPDSKPGPLKEIRRHSPQPQPTQPPNQPAPEAKRHLTKPTLTHTRVHQDTRAAPLGRDRRHSTDDTRQRTQRYSTAAPASRACACSVRAPLFFSFLFFLFFFPKKKKKTGKKKSATSSIDLTRRSWPGPPP